MKKVLLTSLILGSSIAGFSQDPIVRTTSSGDKPAGAFDSFNSATEYSNTDGSDFDLGIYFWNDTNNIAVPYYKRNGANPEAKTDGVLKSTKVRSGDGELAYTVSQPHGLFSPQVGVTFGSGKSLDLTGASSLHLKIGIKMDLTTLSTVASTAKGIKLKFVLKDANGTGIDAKGILGGTTNQWKDELYVLIDKTGKFTISPDLSKTSPPITFDATTTPGVTYVTINFNNAGTDIGYEAVYPKLTDESYTIAEDCVSSTKGDQGVNGASAPKTGFDATKVAGFALTFLQAEQIAGDCYFNTTLTDLKFSLTEFQLGNTTLGIESDELLANRNEVVSVYDMMGKFVATGKLKELGLESGKLYVVKSGDKSRKIIMN